MARAKKPLTFSSKPSRARLFKLLLRPSTGRILDTMRAPLEKLLAEVSAAETMPWESSQLSLYRLIYPADDPLAPGGRRGAIPPRLRR